VQPKKTYRYGIRVRMANPNHNKKNVAYASLAKEKEIVAGDWATVPKVTVPSDVNWYAVDKRLDRDKTYVQIQRWLDVVVDPKNERNEFKVGDWSVYDNAPAFRGEYIGGVHGVNIPTWSPEQEDYVIARNPASRSSRLYVVPVDFTVRKGNARNPALLVDFDGGRREQKLGARNVTDDAPIQVLALTPDGRFEMHTNTDDLQDQERIQRYENWKKRLKEVGQGGNRGPAGRPGNDLFNKGGGGGGVGGGGGGGT